MYENNENRIDDRIVSLTQPHIRPIVRGKSGTPVEFGAKLSASYVNGYIFLDRISWNNFNESGDLINQVESFKQYTGADPESVHADKIYRTKLNRSWCKEKGIRLISYLKILLVLSAYWGASCSGEASPEQLARLQPYNRF